MKYSILILFILISLISRAQEPIYLGVTDGKFINFEDTSDHKYFLLDTSHIWQITRPQKDILFLPGGSGYGEWAALTDTNPYYGNNIRASIQLKLIMTEGDRYGFHFAHKYDFENQKDGGIMEVSHNGGESWKNIISDPELDLSGTTNPYPNGTIEALDNQPGFTGTQSSFAGQGIEWKNRDYDYDTLLLRFTIASDSTDSSNEGWMLDYFEFYGYIVGIEDLTDSKLLEIFPNPASHSISLGDETIANIEIINLLGVKILEANTSSSREIDISGLRPGVYLVRGKTYTGVLKTSKFSKL